MKTKKSVRRKRKTTSVSLNDFDADMTPDKFLLEEEWERQAQLVYDYVKLEAQADEDKARAKLNIDVVKAKVEQEIRDDPEEFGLEKTTDKVVAAAVSKEPRVLEAYDRYFKANKTHRVISGALTSISVQRKKTLEKMFDGRALGIFAEPKATKKVKERIDQLEQQVREGIIKQLNK